MGSTPSSATGAKQAAFEILRPEAVAPVLLVCDHASNQIPANLEGLGLSAADLSRHIAWDIGAANVARLLSSHLNATAVLAGASRLLVDCNRLPGDPTFIWTESDGTIVPGNANLSPVQQLERQQCWFDPYHQAIEAQLERLDRATGLAAFAAIHSFTPMMRDNRPRPWQVGILWDRDPRLAVPLMAFLRGRGFVVGDNEPYSARGGDYTLDRHGKVSGRPHVAFEIRQDMIADEPGAALWARELAAALHSVLGNPDLNRRELFQS